MSRTKRLTRGRWSVLPATVLVLAAVASAACAGFVRTGLRAHTFTITGYYVYPVLDGRTGDQACRGPRSHEGILIQVKKLTRTNANLEIEHTRLPPGQFVKHWKGYGARAVCVHPFTFTDVPSGALAYGVNAACDPGTAFTEQEASGVIVDGYVSDNFRLHPRPPHCHQR